VSLSAERILIVNADDFGYTPGVNRAILECSNRGPVRSTTLMAAAPAFDDAVRLAKSEERLAVGVHLTLTELKPVLPPERLAGLAGPSGLLPAGLGALAACLLRSDARASVAAELRAQVARVVDHGIRPTHLDSHKHVHLLPPVMECAAQIARDFSIRWVRNPFEHPSSLLFCRELGWGQRRLFFTQYAKGRLCALFGPSFQSAVKRAGLRTPDRFYGISFTGLMNRRIVERLLENLPPGVNELMVHPGICDEDLRGSRTRLLRQRELEKEILTSPFFEGMVKRHNITLSCFGEEIR
jgi:chitin disaccharide deacetylase